MKKDKKNNNKNNSNSGEKAILDKALLYKTPGYNIDENEAQYGRSHDERLSKYEDRPRSRTETCTIDRCDIFFKKP